MLQTAINQAFRNKFVVNLCQTGFFQKSFKLLISLGKEQLERRKVKDISVSRNTNRDVFFIFSNTLQKTERRITNGKKKDGKAT